jgi:hypothetical protein
MSYTTAAYLIYIYEVNILKAYGTVRYLLVLIKFSKNIILCYIFI